MLDSCQTIRVSTVYHSFGVLSKDTSTCIHEERGIEPLTLGLETALATKLPVRNINSTMIVVHVIL